MNLVTVKFDVVKHLFKPGFYYKELSTCCNSPVTPVLREHKILTMCKACEKQAEATYLDLEHEFKLPQKVD